MTYFILVYSFSDIFSIECLLIYKRKSVWTSLVNKKKAVKYNWKVNSKETLAYKIYDNSVWLSMVCKNMPYRTNGFSPSRSVRYCSSFPWFLLRFSAFQKWIAFFTILAFDICRSFILSRKLNLSTKDHIDLVDFYKQQTFLHS